VANSRRTLTTRTGTGLLLTLALTLAGTGYATAERAEVRRSVPLSRPEGPCDIYAGAGFPCVAAHGTTRSLYASYNGPLYQVKRPSDGRTLDVGVVPPVASPRPDSGDYADVGYARLRLRRFCG
jgi:non-reducing end alpha-L-arabinofuranosidase